MAAQRKGRIVNIGSVVGLLATPFAGPYCASKAAVHMLSDVLRVECAPFGIDVIVVQPGGVRSNIADTGSKGLERYAREDSLYRSIFSYIQMRAQASQAKPMDTELFAKRVCRALLSQRPPRIIRDGQGSVIYPALSRLPTALIDRSMGWRFGLSSLQK